MARYTIIGSGMIGKALAKKLGEEVAYFPTPDTEVVFYMGGATHLDFEKNPEFHMKRVINDFLTILPYCKQHYIRFIYCSSALVYEKDTTFTKWKRALELIAQCYPLTLGLRIFPVYGPNENKTVVSQWCKDMKKGKQPTVYGDGTQKRDFIYIDDVIDQIITLVNMKAVSIADVGAGQPTSFNDIIALINKILDTNLEPIYIEKPKDYSDGIFCKLPLQVNTTLENGIKTILGQ